MTLVFFGHFEALFRSYLPAGGVSQRVVEFLAVIGHQGVCFFLVLSGYFVYQGYLGNPRGYNTFGLRRLHRIYPPYVAMCGLYVFLSILFPNHSKIPSGIGAIPYLAANLLMISSRPLITVSWTVGTLLALYTLVPLLWAAVRYERWKPAYRIALILAIVAVWQSIPKPIPMLDGRVAFVLVGFALYEAVSAGASFEAGGEIAGLAILGCGYLLWYATDSSHSKLVEPLHFPGARNLLCLRVHNPRAWPRILLPGTGPTAESRTDQLFLLPLPRSRSYIAARPAGDAPAGILAKPGCVLGRLADRVLLYLDRGMGMVPLR
jgi:peptidoglycan/LPS O-acetylase OafA/YrhL